MVQKPKNYPKKKIDKNALFAYGLLLPTIIIIFGFHVLPIFYSFGLAFYNWDQGLD